MKNQSKNRFWRYAILFLFMFGGYSGQSQSVDIYVDDFVLPSVGDEICIPIKVNRFTNIAGIQGSIHWDPTVLKFPEPSPIPNSNIVIFNGVQGVTISTMKNNSYFFGGDVTLGTLTFSWDATNTGSPLLSVLDGDPLFELCFEVLVNNCTQTSLTVDDNPTSLEILDSGLSSLQVTTIPGGSNPLAGADLSISTTSSKICSGTSAILNIPAGFSVTKWSTTQTSPSISVSNGGLYSVTATDASGCTKTADLKILEPDAVDIYSKDQTYDDGTEPSIGSIYSSPSLKVSYSLHSDFGDFSHQNPKYETGFNNYVNLQVINRGCEPAGDNALVYFYYMNSAPWGNWPDRWEEIGVQMINGDIPAGGEIMISQLWLPPNPAPYNKLHTCLLARIVYQADPMAVLEGYNTYGNAQNNNNIVWKNVNIISPTARSGRMQVSNIHENPTDLRVILSFEEFERSFFDNGNEVQLTPDEPIRVLLDQGAIDPVNFYDDGVSLWMQNSRAWFDIPNVPSGIDCELQIDFSMPNEFDPALEDSVYLLTIEQFSNGELDGGVQYQPFRYVDDSPPAVPLNLSAALNDVIEVNLVWEDNSNNEQGFILQRSASDTFNFETLPSLVSQNEQNFLDIGLVPNTTYYYRIKATNEFGIDSEYSNIVEATTGRLSIAGAVHKPNNAIKVADVTVNLTGAVSETQITSVDGEYLFETDLVNDAYTVAPSRNIDFGEDLSNLDIILAKLHILNTQPLCSPYSIIAADASGDANVTNLDLIFIKQVILANFSEFPNGISWRFIPAEHEFVDESAPFPFPESIEIPSLATARADVDFIGVKVGDVSGSCLPNNLYRLKYGEPIYLEMAQQTAKQGDIIEMPIFAKSVKNLETFQYTHTWNPDVLEFVEADNFFLEGMSENDLGQANGKGQLPVLWMSPQIGGQTLADNAILYTLKFKVIGKEHTASQLGITSDLLAAQAYDTDLQQLNIISNMGKVSVLPFEPEKGAFALLPNKPNPFSDATTIQFFLPEADDIELAIYNNLGQVVLARNVTYDRGLNSFEWDRKLTPGAQEPGVYFLYLKAGEHTAIQKMIITD